MYEILSGYRKILLTKIYMILLSDYRKILFTNICMKYFQVIGRYF